MFQIKLNFLTLIYKEYMQNYIYIYIVCSGSQSVDFHLSLAIGSLLSKYLYLEAYCYRAL